MFSDLPTQWRLVILESPYRPEGATAEDRRVSLARNLIYARACVKDCLSLGEAPFASHLIYAQPGVLEDEIPRERAMGLSAGLAWAQAAELTVVYRDLGISPGMAEGIRRANETGRRVVFRTLPRWDCVISST